MKAFTAANAPRVASRAAFRSTVVTRAQASRRETLAGTSALLVAAAGAPAPALAKGLKGFSAVRDNGDGYEFAYPFGWQEVQVEGVDVVYKDIIEPLETVAVQLVATEKGTILEYGEPNEVAGTLAESVLSNPRDEVQLVKSELEQTDGRDYILFEFLQKSSRFTRHVLAACTVANGKLVLFTIGSNERRWNKMKDKCVTALKTFKAFNVY